MNINQSQNIPQIQQIYQSNYQDISPLPQIDNMNLNQNISQSIPKPQKNMSQNYNSFKHNSNTNNPKITYIDHGANEDLHVLSVIITILKDSSYDDIYRVPQTSPEGRVAVFQINPPAIEYFLKKFADENFVFDEEFVNSNDKFVENISEIFI